MSIIVVNVIVFIIELMNGDQFVLHWSMVNADVSAGHRLTTILTSMFLHASWSHIIGNMIFLWAFGPEIEDEMGPARYLLFYLVGGVAASLTQVVVAPHSMVPSLGASGAIAAVMGAFLVTFPNDRIRTLLFLFVFVTVSYIPAVVLIGLWFLSQLIDAGQVVSTQAQSAGGVAYTAHIGGMLFGMIFARFFQRRTSTG
ncbi:MAG: rhomboid family intramembrane serine protease [Candidatus Eremiobacteraeota bacterium]|nr:rhomboid family intramembrane serine protease [Candidatus Eremiobacteraeota bacterium]